MCFPKYFLSVSKGNTDFVSLVKYSFTQLIFWEVLVSMCRKVVARRILDFNDVSKVEILFVTCTKLVSLIIFLVNCIHMVCSSGKDIRYNVLSSLSVTDGDMIFRQ